MQHDPRGIPTTVYQQTLNLAQEPACCIGTLPDKRQRKAATSQTRLANWLMKRCPNPQSERPVTIELKMTKRVLAAELGTVSETFSRTLGKFREQKLLTVKGKTVTILSPAQLGALLRRNLGG